MGTGQVLPEIYEKRVIECVKSVKKHFPEDDYNDLTVIQILRDSVKMYYGIDFSLPSDAIITKKAIELFPTSIECQEGYINGAIYMRNQVKEFINKQ